MTVAGYTIIGFVAGSVPFAFLLGHWILHLDIREFGPDRNPGGANAWRAGGWRIGLAGGFLDYLKGFVPVMLAAHLSGLSGWRLVPVAVAPVAGHAFSPWLRFRGGKAVSTSLGVWTALTNGWGLLAFGVVAGALWGLYEADPWVPVAGFAGLLAYLLVFSAEPALLVVWACTGGIVLWKHRRDLRNPVRFRFRAAAHRSE